MAASNMHPGDEEGEEEGEVGKKKIGAENGAIAPIDDDDDDDDIVVRSRGVGTAGGTTVASPEPHRRGSRPRGKGGRRGGALTSKNVPYTRTGDGGTSQLSTGERRSKADDAFEAMGTVDELCSVVGTVHAEITHRVDGVGGGAAGAAGDDAADYGDLPDELLEVMSRLFDVGSHIARPPRPQRRRGRRTRRTDGDSGDSSDTGESGSDEDDDDGEGKTRFRPDGIGGGFDPAHVDSLEDSIDRLTDLLPELDSFVMPTGGRAAAHLHVARTVCRRSERRTVPLVTGGDVDPNALRYLNRLSDYLFSAARFCNFAEGREEIRYRRAKRGATQRGRVTVRLKEEKGAGIGG